jgi:hypothetical protein
LRGCAAGRPTISKAPIAGYFHALFAPKSHETRIHIDILLFRETFKNYKVVQSNALEPIRKLHYLPNLKFG